jgi:beta-N-acetylhexosaminidase
MAAAVDRGEISTERLNRSVLRILEAKKALGLFRRKFVSLDSLPGIVGSAGFQTEAARIAERSIVMVKDVGGTIHGLKTTRPTLALITFGEEDNRTVGTTLAGELRGAGFPVNVFRLWPGSGPASYDSAVTTVARSQVVVFATADRPVAGRGTIGLPGSLTSLISAVARTGPTILVSLGNPYLVSGLPEVGSYLIGWRANSVTEQAVARALSGRSAITGRLPIAIPPAYPRGWGVMRRVP